MSIIAVLKIDRLNQNSLGRNIEEATLAQRDAATSYFERIGNNMTGDNLEKLWGDNKNWPFPGIYYCKDDPRIVIPKQRKWAGFSLNWARPMAIPFLLGVFAVFGSPFFIEMYLGCSSPKTFVLTFLVILAVFIPFLKYMSTRTGK